MELTENDILNSLIYYTEKLDQLRPPFRIFPHSLFYNTLKEYKITLILTKFDRSLWEKINSAHTKFANRTVREIFKLKNLLTFIILIFVILILLLSIESSIDAIFAAFLTVLLGLLLQKSALKEMNDEHKSLAQEIIIRTKDFMKDRKIDPNKFSIQLSHNDYKFLRYNIKDRKYVGYILLEE